MHATYTTVQISAIGDRRRALLVLDRSASPDLVGRISSEISLDLVDGDLPSLALNSIVRIDIELA